MRSVPIVLLLAAVVACENKPQAPADLAQPDLTPLTLPVASQGVADKGDDPHDRLVINVGAKGFVYWKGKKITLDELGAILSNRKEVYNLKMRAKGESGMEKLRGGGTASKLYVLLRADKETPWQHVLWLMTIMAEQKLYKLQLAVSRVADRAYTEAEAARLGAEWVDRAPPEKPRLDAKLDAFLPRDEFHPPPGTPETRAVMHIMARKEIAAKWGPEGVPVRKPTAFKYRLGGRTFDSLEHVGKWIGDALRAARGAPGTQVVGEIQGGHKVPFKQIVAVLNQFHARGVTQVGFQPPLGEEERFWSDYIPDMELRERAYLPYPLKNYPTPK